MKIGDVEYQGDGNKAIFYYIADERVDFRQLIQRPCSCIPRTYRDETDWSTTGSRAHWRVQDLCGRELCCATWMKNFSSVSTTAARIQDISPQPNQAGRYVC